MPWSLEEDLVAASGATDARTALVALEMLEPDAEFFRIEPTSGWIRGGAETYVYQFDVHSLQGTRRFVAKACVAVGDLGGVGAIAAEWLSRRRLVTEAGLSTPRLHALHNATFIEEYIDRSFADAVRDSVDDCRHQLLWNAGQLANRLAELGFPVLSLHDLRSRRSEVVIIDFGEDLGPPGVAHRSSSDVASDVLHVLEAAGVPLSRADFQSFEMGLN